MAAVCWVAVGWCTVSVVVGGGRAGWDGKEQASVGDERSGDEREDTMGEGTGKRAAVQVRADVLSTKFFSQMLHHYTTIIP